MKKLKTFNENLVEVYSCLAQAEPSALPVTNCLLLITTPRTGSTFISEVLNQSKNLGTVDEWFGPKQISAYCEFIGVGRDDFDIFEYIKFIVSRSSSNGWFSCKMHVNHYLYWKKRSIDLMELEWNHVFYIERRDKLKQAVSLARAAQTQSWRSYDRPVGSDGSTPGNVLERLLWLYDLERVYRAELEKHVVHEFVYEDFSSQGFQETFEYIEELIDVPLNAVRPKRLQRQVPSDDNQDVKPFLKWLGKIP